MVSGYQVAPDQGLYVTQFNAQLQQDLWIQPLEHGLGGRSVV